MLKYITNTVANQSKILEGSLKIKLCMISIEYQKIKTKASRKMGKEKKRKIAKQVKKFTFTCKEM